MNPTPDNLLASSAKEGKFDGNRDPIYGVAFTDKVSRVLLRAGRHTVRPRFLFCCWVKRDFWL